jgi:hypothetical protein
MAKCFVIQPFDRDVFDRRYKDVFKPAIEEAGFEPYRVDEDPGVQIPIEEIERGIREAALCFAEITTDNANVWYELGFAIACGKPVVMVCERSRSKFPFDVQHRSIVIYDSGSVSDFETLKTRLVAKLGAIGNAPPSSIELQKFDQLQLQLFDRRIEVYDAVMDFASKLVQKGTVTQDDFTVYGKKARNARFLFNDEVQSYCDEIYKNAANLMVARGVTEAPGSPAYEEMSRSYGELMLWFTQELVSGANKIFSPFLRIRE